MKKRSPTCEFRHVSQDLAKPDNGRADYARRKQRFTVRPVPVEGRSLSSTDSLPPPPPGRSAIEILLGTSGVAGDPPACSSAELFPAWAGTLGQVGSGLVDELLSRSSFVAIKGGDPPFRGKAGTADQGDVTPVSGLFAEVRGT